MFERNFVLLCPVEYFHFGGDKADGRWLQGKEEGCKVKGIDGCLAGHDITAKKSLAALPGNPESDLLV